MNFCSGCLQKAKILVEYPQLLKVYIGCDGCGDAIKKSFSMEDVVDQLDKIKG